MKQDYSAAAATIAAADALIITTGAGMGVDSGLPDFRGDQGFWKAYPMYERLGLSFIDAANPRHLSGTRSSAGDSMAIAPICIGKPNHIADSLCCSTGLPAMSWIVLSSLQMWTDNFKRLAFMLTIYLRFMVQSITFSA